MFENLSTGHSLPITSVNDEIVDRIIAFLM